MTSTTPCRTWSRSPAAFASKRHASSSGIPRCSRNSDVSDITRRRSTHMARITVDDCIEMFPNRFELTLAVTYRARQLAQGSQPLVETKDKPIVTALREIAAGKVGREILNRGRA